MNRPTAVVSAMHLASMVLNAKRVLRKAPEFKPLAIITDYRARN